jgi:truncated hemoglobin YjbI
MELCQTRRRIQAHIQKHSIDDESHEEWLNHFEPGGENRKDKE